MTASIIRPLLTYATTKQTSLRATTRVLCAFAQSDVAGGERADQYVLAPQGLFPAPLPPGAAGPDGRLLERFLLLGRAAAKALQDGRLLDIQLSYVFYKCGPTCSLLSKHLLLCCCTMSCVVVSVPSNACRPFHFIQGQRLNFVRRFGQPLKDCTYHRYTGHSSQLMLPGTNFQRIAKHSQKRSEARLMR